MWLSTRYGLASPQAWSRATFLYLNLLVLAAILCYTLAARVPSTDTSEEPSYAMYDV
jgi:hypothetical protein